MPLIVNGTTIPTNVANAFSFNGTNITNVICNGTNVWTQSLAPSTIDVLVVAGGGAGGEGYAGLGPYVGGGGGAGGMCEQSGRSISAGTWYTITVGAGGAGGKNGSNSSFDTITSIGGGGGGCGAGEDMQGGLDGGSGGGSGNAWGDLGGGGRALQDNSGGATGYGNNGGSTPIGRWDGPCYGGGAGASGDTTGAGRSNSITGSSVTYAKGGTANGLAGATNSGNGGGPKWDHLSVAGGSGVVIVSYPNTYPTATVTGSPTYTNTGGYHIYKFTGSGTIRW